MQEREAASRKGRKGGRKSGGTEKRERKRESKCRGKENAQKCMQRPHNESMTTEKAANGETQDFNHNTRGQQQQQHNNDSSSRHTCTRRRRRQVRAEKVGDGLMRQGMMMMMTSHKYQSEFGRECRIRGIEKQFDGFARLPPIVALALDAARQLAPLPALRQEGGTAAGRVRGRGKGWNGWWSTAHRPHRHSSREIRVTGTTGRRQKGCGDGSVCSAGRLCLHTDVSHEDRAVRAGEK